jgi:tRNA modification GTPase
VGKSTLNALLRNAIVSSRWNYRDTIEDELVIGGIGFRFIDTAGIRETRCGGKHWYQKTFEKIEQAQLVIYLMDSLKFQVSGSESMKLKKIKTNILKQILIVANKIN